MVKRCAAVFVALTAIAPAMASQEAEGRIERDGVEIFYRCFGSGPPLLMHGFLSTGEQWAPFVDALGSEYRVIVPDMRGHGRSTNPTSPFLHRQSAADMLSLLDELEIETVRAAGYSSGAMTLLHAATLEPERFASLVLIAGTSYFPESSRALQRGLSLDEVPREIAAALRREHPGGDSQVRALVSQFNAMAETYDDMTFTPPHLGTIGAETLIIHGDRDEHFPVEIAVEMYRAIPNAYLWIVPNGNHFLAFVPEYGSFPGAEALLPVMREFLGGEWSRSGDRPR